MWRLKIWWNLSKLVTNTLVNFDNFFNYIILSPVSLLRKKISSENAVREEWAIPVCVGVIMMKTWRRVLLGGWVKLKRFNFLTHKCICSSLNAMNLKLSRNYGEINRFRRKFKKGTGDIKPLGVQRNMIINNWQYVCLLLCWSWPNGWDNFQKKEDSRKWDDWFGNSGYRHLRTLVLVH